MNSPVEFLLKFQEINSKESRNKIHEGTPEGISDFCPGYVFGEIPRETLGVISRKDF